MDTIYRLQLPVNNCVTELLPRVKTPVVYNLTTSEENDNSTYGYPLFNQLITVNDEIYGMMFWIESNSDPEFSKFNKVTKTFEETFTVNIPTYGGAVIVGTDKIYFYGGKFKTDSTYSNKLYEYDLITKILIEKGSGGISRWKSCGCQVGRKILIFGGSDSSYVAAFTEYDLDTGIFTNNATTPVMRNNGKMITFNGFAYLTGAIDSPAADTDVKKIWKWNTTTSTWSEVGIIPETCHVGSMWTVINNELCLFNTATTTQELPIIISKFTEGVGFTEIFGPNITPTQNLSIQGFKYLSIVAQIDSDIYYKGNANSFINGTPTADIFGTINLVTNSLTIDKFNTFRIKGNFCSSKMIITIPDNLSLIRIKLYGTGADWPIEGYLIFDIPYDINMEGTENCDVEFLLPTTISSNTITAIQIAHKSLNSIWSNFSNKFYYL